MVSKLLLEIDQTLQAKQLHLKHVGYGYYENAAKETFTYDDVHKRFIKVEKKTTFNEKNYVTLSKLNYLSAKNEVNDLEKEAISLYADTMYEDINGFLRGNTDNDYCKNTILDLKNAIDKNKLEKSTKLYRGIRNIERLFQDDSLISDINKFYQTRKISKKAKDSLIGMEIQDHGFLSTSCTPTIASSNFFTDGIMFEIHADKGTHCVKGKIDEQEFILGTGTKLEIFEVTVVGGKEFTDFDEVLLLKARILK